MNISTPLNKFKEQQERDEREEIIWIMIFIDIYNNFAKHQTKFIFNLSQIFILIIVVLYLNQIMQLYL